MPGLSWDAMLKYTGVELELITDPDMRLMLEKSMRGCISNICHRHATSNHPSMDTYMENLRKLINFEVVTSRKVSSKRITKPNFKRIKIFREDLVGIHMVKPVLVMNRPIQVGFAILDLSKYLMYDFHYNTWMKKFPNSTLLFTDTDSLVYKVVDLYAGTHFDCKNGEEVDKPTDTSVTRIVLDNKVTAKWVKAGAAKKLSFGDYEYCLNSLLPKLVDIRRIGSDLHKVFTYSTEKIGLSAFDSKRWICDDGISTYAFGQWKTELYM